MNQRDDLYRAVMESVNDDGPRLVYADWLDEHGEPERAEFIRRQISNPKHQQNWCLGDSSVGQSCPYGPNSTRFCPNCETTRDDFGVPEKLLGEGNGICISRGFPDSVSLSLTAFMGVECTRCAWVGGTRRMELQLCTVCKGTGRTEGLAKRIGAWPVTGVRLSDQVAHPSVLGMRVAWFHPLVPAGLSSPNHELTQELFIRLEKFKNNGAHSDRVRWYESRAEANAAISLAAVNYARSLNGYGALEPFAHGSIPEPVSRS